MGKAKKCPKCGVTLKPDNIVDHFKKVHPRSKEDMKLLKEETLETQKRGPRRASGKRPVSMWLFLGSLIAIAIIILAFALSPQEGGPPPGSLAPSFTLLDVDGRTITFPDDYMNDIVVLDFFQAHCYGCQNNTKNTLVEVYNNYKGVTMISIDIDSREDEAKIEWFKSKFVRPYTTDGESWTFALDRNQITVSYWGQYTPTTYIVRNGEIFFKHLSGPGGMLTYEELSLWLDAAIVP